ncbi:MAG: hypothetical protein QOE55_1277 [Acidobacteriaceae bacterium]|jgi:hypothetical protein|nr:hypothetical protein [Acidobacteriaceae bacterium]
MLILSGRYECAAQRPLFFMKKTLEEVQVAEDLREGSDPRRESS